MFDRKKYMREYGAKWRKKNAEKAREYNLRYKQENKNEIKEKRQTYRGKNSFKISQQIRERKFKSRYGITKAEYDLLCASQDFSCAICNDQVLHPKRLHVDHDHTTGEIRGLLCGNCNRGIGLMRDNPVILANAIKYLSLKTQHNERRKKGAFNCDESQQGIEHADCGSRSCASLDSHYFQGLPG